MRLERRGVRDEKDGVNGRRTFFCKLPETGVSGMGATRRGSGLRLVNTAGAGRWLRQISPPILRAPTSSLQHCMHRKIWRRIATAPI